MVSAQLACGSSTPPSTPNTQSPALEDNSNSEEAIICADPYHTYGLQADGTVVYTEDPEGIYFNYNISEVTDWTDIVALAAGDAHAVGLRIDSFTDRLCMKLVQP